LQGGNISSAQWPSVAVAAILESGRSRTFLQIALVDSSSLPWKLSLETGPVFFLALSPVPAQGWNLGSPVNVVIGWTCQSHRCNLTAILLEGGPFTSLSQIISFLKAQSLSRESLIHTRLVYFNSVSLKCSLLGLHGMGLFGQDNFKIQRNFCLEVDG
jgi:hypothetical protein